MKSLNNVGDGNTNTLKQIREFKIRRRRRRGQRRLKNELIFCE